MFNSGAPNGPKNKNQMDPKDMKNMFIFFIVAAVLYFTYDAFILKPQTQALKVQAAAERTKAENVNTAEALQAQLDAMPKSREELVANTAQRIEFDNGEVFGTIDLQGGRIDDLSLHKYFKTLDKEQEVNVLSPRGSQTQRTIEYGWVADTTSPTPVPTRDTRWQVLGSNTKLTKDSPVTLFWDNGQGVVFERKLSLDENYMFTINQRVINNSGQNITLYPYGILAQRGMPADYQGTWISYEGPIGYLGDELVNMGYNDLRKEQKETTRTNQGWLGFTDKYWLSAIIPPQGIENKYSFTYSGDKDDKENKGLFQADFLGGAVSIAPGQSQSVESQAFAGAKEVLKLKEYQDSGIVQFDLAVDFGWFWFMTMPFFYILHYVNLLVGNMGIAIIILTIMIRGAAFPLTNISYRSFAKMKVVGPQVAALREQYADDKQKMQEELIKMYQREQVNPMSGCFPILLQIPVFFALYKTFFVTIELRHAPFFGWIEDLSARDPTSIFNLFGLIPWDPPTALTIGVWPCLMLVAMMMQKKLNPPPTDAVQRDIANYMPFIFAYIMGGFAAGLVIYWTFSAFIGVIQQIIIMKSMNVPVYLFGEKEPEQPEPTEGVHPLAVMAEREVEEALFEHDDDDDTPPTISPPKRKKSKKKKK